MTDTTLELPSRLKDCAWQPYRHQYDDATKVNGYRLSNGKGYVLPEPDSDRWWVTWAHPDLCGRPGWHHAAFGTYGTKHSAMIAFEQVYALEYAAGNRERCDIPVT